MDTLPKPDPVRVVLVTGPAGAGRSTAIRALEDIGYEAIDNLPLSLIPRLLNGPPLGRPIALGIDPRNRDFALNSLIETFLNLQGDPSIKLETLYLECSVDVLLKRYSETRRRHPSAPDESPEVGIAREMDLLVPIKSRADVLIDTSELSVHDLKAQINSWFGAADAETLAVTLQSFSYKRGLPSGVDTIFDCRFLRNPYWEPELRSLNGQDIAVQSYVKGDALYDAFFEQIKNLALLLLPAYRKEGKAHFLIGFGCTGGQHRSVTVTEHLAKALAENGWQVSIRHREVERRGLSDRQGGTPEATQTPAKGETRHA